MLDKLENTMLTQPAVLPDEMLDQVAGGGLVVPGAIHELFVNLVGDSRRIVTALAPVAEDFEVYVLELKHRLG